MPTGSARTYLRALPPDPLLKPSQAPQEDAKKRNPRTEGIFATLRAPDQTADENYGSVAIRLRAGLVG